MVSLAIDHVRDRLMYIRFRPQLCAEMDEVAELDNDCNCKLDLFRRECERCALHCSS